MKNQKNLKEIFGLSLYRLSSLFQWWDPNKKISKEVSCPCSILNFLMIKQNETITKIFWFTTESKFFLVECFRLESDFWTIKWTKNYAYDTHLRFSTYTILRNGKWHICYISYCHILNIYILWGSKALQQL